ncbi:MAG TPA: NAD(P)/FAD-dependent oxidoreductase [Streptosporangiaceae bacterium]|jgi:NADH dehydrogenase|nr:NAD(P)/FAD-dependent oxidoreductase [Streptosporangiaceae bacterium]
MDMKWRRGRQQPRTRSPRVIVVGAGFAGLAAVAELARTDAQVMLVDRNVYSTFQPLLYQVATAGLNPGDIAYPVRSFTRRRGVRFRLGEVTDVDTRARRIRLADGGEYEYDYLVLATGVTTAYYGVTGAAEHTMGLYTRRDAISLRDHIMAWLERLDVDGPGRDINFTVVGGGATGVELAGALAELRSTALAAAFPEIDGRNVHIRLVEQLPVLLGPFHPALQRYAYQQLVRRGVEVRLSAQIREVTPDQVLLAGGEDLPSDITVWAAGVAAPPAIGQWGLPQGRGGRIRVGPDLAVAGQPGVFAAGDIAVADGQPLPQLAPAAIQGGRHAARQIRRLIAGRPTVPFGYRDKGIMATIGRRSAVVQLPARIRIRGTLAWLSWVGLHVVQLLGNRNRLSTLLNLAYRYVSWGHGAGMIVGDDPAAIEAAGPLQLTGAAPDRR